MKNFCLHENSPKNLVIHIALLNFLLPFAERKAVLHLLIAEKFLIYRSL
jgi:hypothetical protein